MIWKKLDPIDYDSLTTRTRMFCNTCEKETDVMNMLFLPGGKILLTCIQCLKNQYHD